jgi:signal transduction histidine kinase
MVKIVVTPMSFIEKFVETDRIKLQQVARILLKNAVKFSMAGGSVEVQAEMVNKSSNGWSGKYLEVSIKDYGQGMTKKEQ